MRSRRRLPRWSLGLIGATVALILIGAADRAAIASSAQDMATSDTSAEATEEQTRSTEAAPTPVVPKPPIATEPAATPDQTLQTGGGLATALTGKEREPVPWTARLQSLLGIGLMLLLAWSLSTNRKQIPWRIIAWGLGLQFTFAVLVLKTAPGRWTFEQLNTGVNKLLEFTTTGSRFVFGNLVDNDLTLVAKDPAVPFDAGTPVALDGYAEMHLVVNNGSFFAFNVLPTIIFFSALMAVLYHLGVMQALVRAMGWLMFKTMRTSGAETLSAAANIFVGQTEAPLVIRPYVGKMTLSELNAVMTGGFATVAGGVMAAYVALLSGIFPDIAGHLVAASVMSAPAALVIAKLMWPEDGSPTTAGTFEMEVDKVDVNVIDAAARGAGDGMKLALNVGAMLLAFIALVALANGLLGAAGSGLATVGESTGLVFLTAVDGLTLEALVGYVFWPLAWAMGVPAAECTAVGELLGIKTILNEFYAYFRLKVVAAELSYRSMVIVTYALCGFANLGSIGIQLGGIGGIAPSRRSDLARVGFRAMIAGTLAAFLTANIAGTLVG